MIASFSSAREGKRVDEIRDYMPALPSVVIEEIECPITTEELGRVIATLPIGKSLGPDGLTNVYYKKFISRLASPLCGYFNSINASNPLPPEALLAYITVLPKPGKDLQYSANYRPISLLISNTKLLAKILAIRLQDHIVKLVQIKRVLWRAVKLETICALHILHWMQHGPDKTPRVALSMDAEKAFDRVNWVFMIEVLRGGWA